MEDCAINLFNEQRNLTDEESDIYNKRLEIEAETINKINCYEKGLKITDFDKFKKFFDDIGIEYKVNNDCLYLDAFASHGGLLIVVDFYEDGKFQCFSSYPDNTASKPERIGKWWIERDKERCVKPYHCGNCDIYGSYIGHSSISKYCPVCGIKMDTSKVYEYEEVIKEVRQKEC